MLEREALRSFLVRQRWFGGKAREVDSVRFMDWADVDTGAEPLCLTLVGVTYRDGSTEQYHIPLTVIGSADIGERPEVVLARAGAGSDELICDAVCSEHAMRALLGAVWGSAEFRAMSGRVVFHADRPPPADESGAALAVVRLPGVHRNTALAVGGRYLMTLVRRIEPGINPDVEIGGFLARTGAHVNAPALLGHIEYRSDTGAPSTLALVQALVPTRGNAWEDALERIDEYFERAGREPATALAGSPIGAYAGSIALLGRRTAELHLALAAAEGNPDFEPETTSDVELSHLAIQERREAAEVLDLVARRGDLLDDEASTKARFILDRRQVLFDRLDRSWREIRPFMKIRIHGDYHLGQVLCVEEDFVIIDFEGEPARPLADRRAKQSPLRDVAGMLRSLDYAGETGLRAAVAGGRGTRERLVPWAREWVAATSAAFLRGYLDAARGAPLLPSDPQQLRKALDLFMLGKAIYELRYELNNRPQWAATPLGGIMQILDSGSTP
jgi:trehalose synthase-fused probable maltokinase